MSEIEGLAKISTRGVKCLLIIEVEADVAGPLVVIGGVATSVFFSRHSIAVVMALDFSSGQLRCSAGF